LRSLQSFLQVQLLNLDLVLFQELENCVSGNFNRGRVVHWVEGPILMLEQSLINDTALDLVLLIIGQSEYVDTALLCLENAGYMLLFGHSYVVMCGTDLFPESFT
jgi:hypothetical protein